MIDLSVLNRGFSNLGKVDLQKTFVQSAQDIRNVSKYACINAIRDFLTRLLFPETYREQTDDMETIGLIVESSLADMSAAMNNATVTCGPNWKQFNCELDLGGKIYIMHATEINGSTELIIQPKRVGIYIAGAENPQVEIDPDEISVIRLKNVTIASLQGAMAQEAENLLQSGSSSVHARWHKIEHCFSPANSTAAFLALRRMYTAGATINDEIRAFTELANLAIPDSPDQQGFRKLFQISLNEMPQNTGKGKITVHLKVGELSFARETCDISTVAETLLGLDQIPDMSHCAHDDAEFALNQKNIAQARTVAPERLDNLSLPEKVLLIKMFRVMYKNGGHAYEDDADHSSETMRIAMYDTVVEDVYQTYRPGERFDAPHVEFAAANEQVASLELNSNRLTVLHCLDYGTVGSIFTKFNQVGYTERDGVVEFTMVEPLVKVLLAASPLFNSDDSGSEQLGRNGTIQIYANSTLDFHRFQENRATIQEPLTILYRAHGNTLNIGGSGGARNILAARPA